MAKFYVICLPILLLATAAVSRGQNAASGAIALTPEQKQVLRQKVQALEASSKTQTEQQNARIAEIAKKIDRNLLSGKPDEELDRKLSADFAAEVSAMVSSAVQSKLSATRDMVKVLTPDQRAALMAELEKPGTNPDITDLIDKVLAK